jgi:hypothetical protein
MQALSKKTSMKTLLIIVKPCLWLFLPAWLFFFHAIASAAEPANDQPARDPSACELVIEGKGIEKLVLVNTMGQDKVISRPDPSVFMPPGEYWIREIQLQGGYSFYAYYNSDGNQFTLNRDAPYKLKAGAPLTPSVTVKRHGRLLTMDYQLLDSTGRKYLNQGRTNPPQYAIYQGDQKIASGQFEYG